MGTYKKSWIEERSDDFGPFVAGVRIPINEIMKLKINPQKHHSDVFLCQLACLSVMRGRNRVDRHSSDLPAEIFRGPIASR